jgi:hypothetical protein
VTCTSGNVINIVDTAGYSYSAQKSLWIAIGPDGLPVISYHYSSSQSAGDLRVVHCGTYDCAPDAGGAR